MADLVTDVLQTTVQPASDTANHLGSVGWRRGVVVSGVRQ